MHQHLERRVRGRAYEISEREGQSGDPEDHWLRAEHELGGTAPTASDASEATKTGDMDADKLGDFARGQVLAPPSLAVYCRT